MFVSFCVQNKLRTPNLEAADNTNFNTGARKYIDTASHSTSSKFSDDADAPKHSKCSANNPDLIIGASRRNRQKEAVVCARSNQTVFAHK